MNEVALEIIKRLAEELNDLRAEAKALKEQAESKEHDADFWYQEWKQLRQKCIDGGFIKENGENDPLPPNILDEADNV